MSPRGPRKRKISFLPDWEMYGPRDSSDSGQIRLKVEELEAIRLNDHEGYSQQEAAEMMEVSQPTLHRILRAARKKIGQALTEGKILHLHGGSYTVKKTEEEKK